MRYWIYHPSERRASGPFEREQVRLSPEFGPESLVAQESAPEANPWKPAREVPEFALYLKSAETLQMPPTRGLASPEAAAAADSLASFWFRAGALAVDAAILAVVGQILGFVFFYPLIRLGPWGRPLGFSIALAYFVAQTGFLTRGQTVGKRLLNIRVVDAQGKPLSLGKVFLRESILLLPFFLNNALLPKPFNTVWAGSVTGCLVFLLSPSLVYLAVCNTRTRQGLHDLAAGSFVVGPEAEDLATLPAVWPGHYIVMGVAMNAVLLAALFAERAVARMPGLQGMVAAYNEFEASGHWRVRSLTRGERLQGGSRSSEVRLITVTSWPLQGGEKDTDQLGRILFKDYPEAATADHISVYEAYGYDIGIASRWHGQGVEYTPAEWHDRFFPPPPDTTILPHPAPVDEDISD